MTTRVLPIAQSSTLVTYTILVNGEPLPQHFPLFGLEVINEVNRIPSASLFFSDGNAATGEWRLSSETYFIPGNEVTIQAGYHSEEETIFSGIVVGQSLRVRSNRLELQVTCKDKAIALTASRKSRHFQETTDSDAVNEILGDYELQAGEIASTDITHTDLVQFDSTDWDFIVMRMEANGLVCVFADAVFTAVEPSLDGVAVTTIQLGANVIEFDGNINALRQWGSVTAKSWDPATQDYATGESNAPSWTTPGNFSSDDLSAAAGSTVQNFIHSGAVTAQELQSWSDAQVLRSRMSFSRGRVRVKGISLVNPGGVIELGGFGDRFNGSVWVSAVRHEIANGGWTTDIEFGLSEEWHAKKYEVSCVPANGMLAAVSGLHTGVVTALEGDPQSESRIRVKIPSIDLDGEGVWARVATLDAGSSRGSFFLPEIDDEVLVGFLNDDPRHPIVLGMLHSSALPPPEEAKDDNPIKGFYSRTGMRVQFDDEKTILTIDTPGGHSFILDDDAGEVTLFDSNKNKITMSSSGIALESGGDITFKASGNVKVEAQANVELKATAQYKAKGSAGVEINSSAVTVVKGSLVQIN
jgi:Rhs element Vgr protein